MTLLSQNQSRAVGPAVENTAATGTGGLTMSEYVSKHGEEALARMMQQAQPKGKTKLPPTKRSDCGKHGGGSASARTRRLEERREAIVKLLTVRKMTAAQISEVYDRSAKRISADLRELKARGLIDCEGGYGGRGVGLKRLWFAVGEKK
jgi:predicted HTH transcriptional regulator